LTVSLYNSSWLVPDPNTESNLNSKGFSHAVELR
jgi:hypothetical protein